MKLQTKYFGEIDYETSDLIHFPTGLFGFDEEHDFLLLPFEGSHGNMLCLQSIATPQLAFVALDPFSLSPSYTPVLQPEELKTFGVEENQALCYYVLCAIKSPVSTSTVNLRCPIVIHPETRVARQIILESGNYEMRHPLSEFSKHSEEAASC